MHPDSSKKLWVTPEAVRYGAMTELTRGGVVKVLGDGDDLIVIPTISEPV